MKLRTPHPLHIALLLGLLRLCSPARQHRVSRHYHQAKIPVPTSETIALVAAEMGAATFEETMEDDSQSTNTGRRVQRKLVTGIEDVDGNTEYQEYQGVMGRPGVDFPVLPNIPITSFSCRSVKASGYYADLDTDCQVFHICDGGRKISFLCPNGTIFRQSHLICDWWFRVDCGKSVEQYEESAEQLAADQQVYRQRAEAIAKAMQKSPSSGESERAEPSSINILSHSGERPSHFKSGSSSSSSNEQSVEQKDSLFSNEQHRRKQRPSNSKSTTPKPSSTMRNYPQHNYHNSQEKENQLPAETAAFASNRGNHQYIQHFYYSSTTEAPGSAHTPSGKAYVELNRNRNGFSSSTSTTPSPPSDSSRRNSQRNSNHRSSNHKPSSSSTSSPIFTVKVKPNKSFSYVELHRSRGPHDKSHEDTASSQHIPQYPGISSTERSHPSSISASSQRVTVTPHSQIGTSTSNPSKSSSFSPLEINGLGPSNSGHFITVTPSQTTISPVFLGSSPFPTTINEVFFTTVRPFFDIEDDSFHLGNPFAPVSTVFYDNTVTTLPPPTETENYLIYNSTGKAKSLKDIVEGDEISPEAINSLQYLAEELKHGNRSNIKIPDSSGAKALHSLALYFAADSATTTQLPETVQPTNSKVSVSEILLRSHSGSPDDSSETEEVEQTSSGEKELPSVLTKTTKDSYAYLFPNENNKTSKAKDETYSSKSRERGSKKDELQTGIKKDDISNDLSLDQSRGIVQPTMKSPLTTTEDLSEDLQLRDSTDLRELAQVFSRALSAYLEDPESFRRVLSEVRPTEPTPADGTTLPDENEEEVLDFSDVKSDPKRLYQSSATTVTYQESATESPFQENIFNIAEINNLANENNVSPEPSIHLTAPPIPQEPETNYYTTVSPASFAEDVNNFIGLHNATHIESPDYYTHESFDNYFPGFPTAGGVHDNSRPRFGGFHNNSKAEITTTYSPYGAGIPANLTGQPLVQGSPSTSTNKPKVVSEVTSSYPTPLQTSISIQSIPQHLNVVPPHDVNNLLSNNNYYSTASSENILRSTAQPIVNSFGHNEKDQEKLLITSGSQSLVSRDNYIRYLNNNNNNNNNQNNNVKTQHNGSNENSKSRTSSSTPKYLYGEKTVNSNSQSVESAEQHSEYQAVNLGNGVTLERTKSVRYSTPTSTTGNGITWTVTVSPIIDTGNRKYGSTSQIDLRSPTPSPHLRSSPVTIIPTTYHPSTSQPLSAQPDATPRGHQRVNWQWDVDVNKTDRSNYITPTPAPFRSSIQDFFTPPKPTPADSTYKNDQFPLGSTLMPDVSTFINNIPENFEKKAKEMFGSLNETTANALMEVMHEAESNMTIRRLVLLLVADKSGRENKTIEESRSQLIQALLRNPGDKDYSGSSEQSTIISNKPDVHSKRGSSRYKDTIQSSTTSTTTTTTTTTTPKPSTTTQKSRNSKSYRGTDAATANRGVTSSRQLSDVFPSESDSRAVELLKSLYTLAARWG